MITSAQGPAASVPARAITLLLALWFVGVSYVTWPSFQWQIEYFKTPGEGYYRAILVVILALLLGTIAYARLRGSQIARWEPLLFAIPPAIVLVRHPWGSLAALLLGAGFYAVGRAALRALRLDPSEWIAGTAFGVSAIGLALGGVAAAGMLSRGLLWVLALALAVAGVAQLPRIARGIRALALNWPQETTKGSAAAGLFVPFMFLVALSAAFVVATPPLAHDAVNFHLPLAQKWTETGGLEPSLRSAYSYYPQIYELLMALALAAGGDACAKGVTAILAVVGLAGVGRVCRLAGGGTLASAVSILLVGSVPAIHWSASVIKNDFLMVSLQVSALVCLLRERESANFRWAVLGAWLLGSSFGVKHSALFGGIGLSLFFLFACLRHRRKVGAVAVLAVVVGCTATPWHLRTYVQAGTVTFPADSKIASRVIYSDARPTLLRRLERIPTTIRISHLEGQDRVFENILRSPVGVLMSLLVPLPLLLRRREWTPARLIVASSGLLTLGYWIMTTAKIRYGMAGLAILAPVIAIALVKTFNEGSRSRRAWLAAAALYGLIFGWTGVLIIENSGPQVRYIAGLMDRDAYIRSVQPGFPALQALSSIADDEDDIYAANCCVPYYYRRGWKVDCRATTAPPQQWREMGHPGPPDYEYVARAWWLKPERLGIPADSEVVYEDRVCTIHRLSPGWIPEDIDFDR